MLDHFSPLILVWVLTYIVHSSVLIALAFLLERTGLLKKTRNAELVWRFALFGALLTATAQLGLSANSDTGPAETNSSTRSAYVSNDSITSTDIRPLTYPLPEKLQISRSTSPIATAAEQSQDQVLAALHKTTERFNQSAVQVELPTRVQETTSYIVLAWALIALFGCLVTYRSARYLNRLAAYFPDADKSALKHLLNQLSEEDQTRIQLKVSEQWNSPFVTPDNTICIPRWAYTTLNRDQRDAMLAHEVAHVLRRDPAWRVAMQILSRVCFFQPLHRIAIRKLELLAELACDENAAVTSGKPHELAEALYACARVFKNNEAPSLALAMSRQGSPLIKRISSLLDQDLLAQAAIPQTRSARFTHYSVLCICLMVIVYTTPNILVSFEKASPQLHAAVRKAKDFVQEVKIAANIAQSSVPVVAAKKIETKLIDKNIERNTVIMGATNEGIFEQRSSVAGVSEKVQTEGLFEANRLREKRDFSKAIGLYQMLAEKGSVEAQQALGEIYWYGKGVANNPTIAKEWFRKAAANGAPNAHRYLDLLAERDERQTEINYYTNDYDGKDLKFSEMNCTRPEFDSTAHNSVDIENMINQINEFAACFNKYGERLNASKNVERLVPDELLRLMTNEEVEIAINRSIRTLATIRLTANIIADDFSMDKRSWENRTREYFRGARSRDWASIKRVALVDGVNPELAIMHDPQLVKIDTETRLNFKLH